MCLTINPTVLSKTKTAQLPISTILRRESVIAEQKLFDRYVELECEERNIDPDEISDDKYTDILIDVIHEINKRTGLKSITY